MDSVEFPIKDSNISYFLCDFCKEEKGRSRKFHSLHALKWHLTNNHGDEIKK